ncbi:hypothetical protein ABZX77_50450 [Streptomyces sp. NPDC004237]|uniref:hypothetical protein n=1 Tax=Streptomyces sp. NPDC004237 TaxID=3154455 RepID=UPI0033B0E83A
MSTNLLHSPDGRRVSETNAPSTSRPRRSPPGSGTPVAGLVALPPVTVWAFHAKSVNALRTRARCRHRSESRMASKYNLLHVEA